MQTYIALLRGINVGGKAKVEMAQLKTVFESLGYTNVRTYINSGNVIFKSQDINSLENIREEIEKALQKKFHFPVRTLLRDAQQITNLVKKIPSEWKNDSTHKTDVLFLWDDYSNKNSLDLLKINPNIDFVKYIDGSIIWHIERSNYNKSGMRTFIGTTLYKNMTARNVNTVRKLGELLRKE